MLVGGCVCVSGIVCVCVCVCVCDHVKDLKESEGPWVTNEESTPEVGTCGTWYKPQVNFGTAEP